MQVGSRAVALLGVTVMLSAVGLFAQAPAATAGGTQFLVTLEGKNLPPGSVKRTDVVVKVDGKKVPITAWTPLLAQGEGAEMAFLLDDSLRVRVVREFTDMKQFFNALPSSIQVGVGYMTNGNVMMGQGFTSNRDLDIQGLRIPGGSSGTNGNPYFCLSSLAKNWPSRATNKARIVLMVSNGVDRYDGPGGALDLQDPYVDAAIKDAQRAGITVFSIYFQDQGFNDRTDLNTQGGQSRLQQVSQGTGGVAFYQGSFNPVSFTPFFDEFRSALANQYVVTVQAPGKGLQRLKVNTELHHVKVTSPDIVMIGRQIDGVTAN